MNTHGLAQQGAVAVMQPAAGLDCAVRGEQKRIQSSTHDLVCIMCQIWPLPVDCMGAWRAGLIGTGFIMPTRRTERATTHALRNGWRSDYARLQEGAIVCDHAHVAHLCESVTAEHRKHSQTYGAYPPHNDTLNKHHALTQVV